MSAARGPLAAVVLAVAVALTILLTPTAELRGANEIDFMALSELKPDGGAITQEVPAQHSGLSAIEIPYKSPGAAAEVEVTVRSGGSALVDRRLTLVRTDRPDLAGMLRPSVPEGLGAGAFTVAFPPQPAGVEVEVRAGPGPLELFVSRGDQRLPPLAGDDRASLALRSEYGERRPAVLFAGVLLDRLATWAPPWLPSPVLALLLLVTLAGAAAAAGRAARG